MLFRFSVACFQPCVALLNLYYFLCRQRKQNATRLGAAAAAAGAAAAVAVLMAYKRSSSK
jgi:hypothetical protein